MSNDIGQRVNATIRGVEVKGLVVMESKYPGYDIHAQEQFGVGTVIVYKNSKYITIKEESIFADLGRSPQAITAQWPLKQMGEVTNAKPQVPETKTSPFTPNPFQEKIWDRVKK